MKAKFDISMFRQGSNEAILIILYARNQYEGFLYVYQCQSRWNVICFYSLKIQMGEKD